MVGRNKEKLDKIAQALVRKETLDVEEIKFILDI